MKGKLIKLWWPQCFVSSAGENISVILLFGLESHLKCLPRRIWHGIFGKYACSGVLVTNNWNYTAVAMQLSWFLKKKKKNPTILWHKHNVLSVPKFTLAVIKCIIFMYIPRSNIRKLSGRLTREDAGAAKQGQDDPEPQLKMLRPRPSLQSEPDDSPLFSGP